MEALYKRGLEDGKPYEGLFEKASGIVTTVKKNADLKDTLTFIPKAVRQTLYQTEEIAQALKGSSVMETCRNLWYFVYRHIQYKKDDEGFEQIRSPRRAWHDRKTGVDCDCYTVLIASVLTNLRIPHILRITKYKEKHFQHIYPVVPYDGSYIVLDCVTNKFNYEVPYSEKKDYPMDLQYLDGFDENGLAELGRIIERNMNDNTLAGKAKRKEKKAAKAAAKATAKANAVANPGAASKPKKKGFLKKVLNVVNKVNPATVLLRNGVLAAMKLNIKNVAKRLRWSYLSPDKIAEKGIDPERFQKLVATRQKLENIFYGAGGKPENLRKAILGGKGNKDKAVSGLGMLPMDEWSGYMNENTPLQQLLGNDIYYSENVEGMEGFQGFGSLGEPVTLTSVGAAMGVIAGIVSALKKVGDIFKNKDNAGSEDFDETKTDAPENNVTVPPASSKNITASKSMTNNSNSNTTSDDISNEGGNSNYSPTTSETSMLPVQDESDNSDQEMSVTMPQTTFNTETNGTGDNKKDDDKKGFWDKNKKWIKPVAIGIGGITLIAIGYKLVKSKDKHSKSAHSQQSLSGIPRKKKKKSKNQHHKHRHPVALL